MLGGSKAHPEHLRRQPLDGERAELAIAQHEQRRRVARDHRAHDGEEALIPVGRAQALGQIDREPWSADQGFMGDSYNVLWPQQRGALSRPHTTTDHAELAWTRSCNEPGHATDDDTPW